MIDIYSCPFLLDFGKFKTDVNSKNSQIEKNIHPVDEIAETEVQETSRTLKQKAVSGEKSAKSKGRLFYVIYLHFFIYFHLFSFL